MSEEGKVITVTIPTDQIDMFTIDIENSDSSNGYWCSTNWTMSDFDDDMCIPTDHNYTISYGSVHTANYIADEAESKTREIKHHAKEFKNNVKILLTEIKRVSPAGSQSFDLVKDFMDTNYG